MFSENVWSHTTNWGLSERRTQSGEDPQPLLGDPNHLMTQTLAVWTNTLKSSGHGSDTNLHLNGHIVNRMSPTLEKINLLQIRSLNID
jgi:hypothetical protein